MTGPPQLIEDYEQSQIANLTGTATSSTAHPPQR